MKLPRCARKNEKRGQAPFFNFHMKLLRRCARKDTKIRIMWLIYILRTLKTSKFSHS
jgi:hypothetical protein